jgi:predicted MFS family arabinose efflux permease
MLSLAMFRRAGFTAANGISFCLFAGLFGALFLMSQFFQTAQGRSPLQAGAQLLAWSATGLFVASIAGRLAGRYGNRPFMLTGLLMQTAGLACLAIIARTDVPFLEMAPFLAVAGVGTSMVFPTVANEAMASVARHETGIASGNEQRPARTRRRFRRRPSRVRLQPAGRVQLTGRVRRGLQISALDRGRILRGRHPHRPVP